MLWNDATGIHGYVIASHRRVDYPGVTPKQVTAAGDVGLSATGHRVYAMPPVAGSPPGSVLYRAARS